MNILLTNDDGIFAPGLRALWQILSREHQVFVVAPDMERSAIGHAITIHNPIQMKRVSDNGRFFGYALSGTPADCVKIALTDLLEIKPDLVISGINPGANLGVSLYYSGTVSWRNLIEAISWQRQQRPKIGQIAVDWDMLTHKDIIMLLTNRTLNERFGECALRMGYITGFEHIALIGKQRRLQRQIGEYFVNKGIFSSREISHMVHKQRIHNRNAFRWK